MAESDHKNDAQKRKGRVYRQIMYGLSWSNEIRLNVPKELWAHPEVADGWRSGPLVKSMNGIRDPDERTISWRAWAFLGNVVFIQSSVMAPTAFINLRDIAADSRANSGDTPTEGI